MISFSKVSIFKLGFNFLKIYKIFSNSSVVKYFLVFRFPFESSFTKKYFFSSQ